MPVAISQAWRSWKSAPGLAVLAAIAFAVGIGSVTAIYTVVRGVMLKARGLDPRPRCCSNASVTSTGRLRHSLRTPFARPCPQRVSSSDG